MCLGSVTSVKSEKLPKDEYHIGWKAININKDNNTFRSAFNWNRSLNKWLRCRLPLSNVLGIGRDMYPTGFHIFTTREGARNWGYGKQAIVKVHYRRVVARGMQDNYKCVIAKEMYVEKPITDK